MAHEVRAYLERLGDLAYADGLPCVGVSLHRVVVVPRMLLNAAPCGCIETTLSAKPAFASLMGGESLLAVFFQQLVEEMDLLVTKAQPSPKRRLPAGPDWASVGVNTAFVWRPPVVECVRWNGHHYVMEVTRDRITRTLRNQVTESIQRFEALLPSLSHLERCEIVRRASVWRPADGRGFHGGVLYASARHSR